MLSAARWLWSCRELVTQCSWLAGDMSVGDGSDPDVNGDLLMQSDVQARGMLA